MVSQYEFTVIFTIIQYIYEYFYWSVSYAKK